MEHDTTSPNTSVHGMRPTLAATMWVALAIFLTALDIHFVSANIGINGYLESLQVSQGVFDGLPTWRIYQNRILGPYLIHGIERLFGLSSLVAYISFIASCLFITKLIVIRFGLRHTGNVTSTLLMLISGSLLFAMLSSSRWLYPWDAMGLVLSAAFVVMVLRGTSWPWFIPLIAAAFLNRESGIFICVWLFVQGWLGYGEGAGRKPPNIGMMVAAGAAALLGLAETEWLRAHLLIKEINPEVLHIPTPVGTSWFHWQAGNNLANFFTCLASKSFSLPVIFYIFPLTGIAIAIALGVRRYPADTALCLAYGINLVFIFLFGLVMESRVMIEIIPFFSVFLPYVATGTVFHKPFAGARDDGSPKASSANR